MRLPFKALAALAIPAVLGFILKLWMQRLKEANLRSESRRRALDQAEAERAGLRAKAVKARTDAQVALAKADLAGRRATLHSAAATKALAKRDPIDPGDPASVERASKRLESLGATRFIPLALLMSLMLSVSSVSAQGRGVLTSSWLFSRVESPQELDINKPWVPAPLVGQFVWVTTSDPVHFSGVLLSPDLYQDLQRRAEALDDVWQQRDYLQTEIDELRIALAAKNQEIGALEEQIVLITNQADKAIKAQADAIVELNIERDRKLKWSRRVGNIKLVVAPFVKALWELAEDNL